MNFLALVRAGMLGLRLRGARAEAQTTVGGAGHLETQCCAGLWSEPECLGLRLGPVVGGLSAASLSATISGQWQQ